MPEVPQTEFIPFLNHAKWDWYQATISAADLESLKPDLESAYPMASWRTARPQNGYHFGQELAIGERRVLLVCYGGNRGTANIMATGSEAPALYAALRRWGGSFRPTRVDSALDWNEKGLFHALSASLIEYAEQNGLALNYQGDWHRGTARTLYVGSEKSPVRICLYEKGFEQGGQDTKHPHWVRLEVRVKPAKDRRSAAAKWSPADAFGAGWVAGAVSRFFLIPEARFPVAGVKVQSDTERKRAALLRQYGAVLREWLSESDGLEEFGPLLHDALCEVGK